MERLGSWLTALRDHLGRHWQRHLVPLLIALGALVVFGWILIAFYVVIFGGTMLLLALEQEGAAMICFFGVAALGSLFMVCYQLAGAVGLLGYAHFTLRLQRGQEASLRDLLWGFRHPLRSVGFVFVLGVMFFASAGLLYLPLIFLGGWLLLAMPAVASGERGLLRSLGRAWGLSGRAYGPLLVLTLGLLVATFLVSLLPIAGPLVGPFLGLVCGVVVYDALEREEHHG